METVLLIWPLGTNFSEITASKFFSEMLTEIQMFSFNKMPLKMSSAKWRPFCLGLKVLNAKPLHELKCQSLEIPLNGMNRDLPDYINGLMKNMVSLLLIH